MTKPSSFTFFLVLCTLASFTGCREAEQTYVDYALRDADWTSLPADSLLPWTATVSSMDKANASIRQTREYLRIESRDSLGAVVVSRGDSLLPEWGHSVKLQIVARSIGHPRIAALYANPVSEVSGPANLKEVDIADNTTDPLAAIGVMPVMRDTTTNSTWKSYTLNLPLRDTAAHRLLTGFLLRGKGIFDIRSISMLDEQGNPIHLGKLNITVP
jgi:hypothetical protein